MLDNTRIKKIQDFLNNIGLILNSIKSHQTILCQEGSSGVLVKEILCN